MVSTLAFVMGINRKDMDVVIKVGVPQAFEDLVQIVGRAGRDGRNAQDISHNVMLSYEFVYSY